jgi:hypothetical protein
MGRSKALLEMRKAKSSPVLQAKTFAETTSAHGFGFLVQSSGWLSKLIWFFLTLSCTVLAIFFTVRIGLSFLKPPFYTTDISITSDIDKNVSFPDIVVCDPFPWDFEKAAQLNISAQQMSYIARLLYPQGFENDLSKYKDLAVEYTKLLTNYDNNPVNLLNNVTKNCSQTIGFCQIGGTNKSYFGSACCDELFSNVEYTLQYKCFSSGGKNNVLARQASQAFGITVSAFVEDVSLGGSNKRSKLNSTIAGPWAILMTGISAAVTDRKSSLYFLAQTRMKLMEPNTFSILAVEKQLTNSSKKNSAFQSYKGEILRNHN